MKTKTIKFRGGKPFKIRYMNKDAELKILKERERCFGFVELDNLNIHLKGKTDKEKIGILHFNWKLEQEFGKQHKGTIMDLRQRIRVFKQENQKLRQQLDDIEKIIEGWFGNCNKKDKQGWTSSIGRKEINKLKDIINKK